MCLITEEKTAKQCNNGRNLTTTTWMALRMLYTKLIFRHVTKYNFMPAKPGLLLSTLQQKSLLVTKRCYWPPHYHQTLLITQSQEHSQTKSFVPWILLCGTNQFMQWFLGTCVEVNSLYSHKAPLKISAMLVDLACASANHHYQVIELSVFI